MRRLLLLDTPAKENPLLFLAPLNGSLVAQERANPIKGDGRWNALTLTGSGAVRWQPASGARINLAPNPSLEIGTSSWFINTGVAVARVSTWSSSGSWSYQATVNSVVSVPGVLGAYGVGVSAVVVSGQSYVASVDVRNNSAQAREFRCRLRPVDVAMGAVGAVSSGSWVSIPAGGHARIASDALVMPSGASRVYAIIDENTGGSSPAQVGDVWLVDALQIEQGTVPTGYFDGTSSGAVWLDPITGQLGTAHASPSVSQAAAWVEEATTNTVPDPSFEAAVITTNWTARSAATIAKDPTHAYLGANSGRVTCTASASDGILQLASSGAAAASGQVWTISALVRAFAAGDVGKTVKLGMIERTSADAFVAEGFSGAFTLTDSWQTITFTRTLAGGVTVAKVTGEVINGAAVAADFVVDCVQLEQKPYATSYCDGSLGTGYSWAGTAHASSSTRTTAVIQVSGDNRIRVDKGAIALRAEPLIGAAAAQYAFAYIGAGTTRFYVHWNTSGANKWEGGFGNNATLLISSSATNPNTWAFVSSEWDSASGSLYKDTALVAGPTATAGMNGAGSGGGQFNIGAQGSGVATLDGLIGSVAIFARPLTANERAKLASRSLWDWKMLDAA